MSAHFAASPTGCLAYRYTNKKFPFLSQNAPLPQIEKSLGPDESRCPGSWRRQAFKNENNCDLICGETQIMSFTLAISPPAWPPPRDPGAPLPWA